VGFVQAWAEGFAADRYAVAKAAPAYARAADFFRDLRADDNDVQTDWE
jgi:antirestriction protein ArdC